MRAYGPAGTAGYAVSGIAIHTRGRYTHARFSLNKSLGRERAPSSAFSRVSCGRQERLMVAMQIARVVLSAVAPMREMTASSSHRLNPRSDEAVRLRTRWIAGTALSALLLLPAGGDAQQRRAAATSNTPADALTAWGDPDIEGTWEFATITPMQRPPEFAGRSFLTREEADRLEQNTDERRVQNEA